MPVIQNTNTAIGSGIDAAAFLILLQDPKGYAAKLAEFKAAQKAALDAQAHAEAAYTLVGKADEINALHAKAKADRQSAADAINQANNQAAQITADAKTKADALVKDAQEKITSAQNAWLAKAKELDARESEIAAKEAECARYKAAAIADQQVAKTSTDLANAAKVNADNATKLAQERIALINNEFAKFVAAIK